LAADPELATDLRDRRVLRTEKILGNLAADFNFDQRPRPPVVLSVDPKTTLTGTP